MDPSWTWTNIVTRAQFASLSIFMAFIRCVDTLRVAYHDVRAVQLLLAGRIQRLSIDEFQAGVSSWINSALCSFYRLYSAQSGFRSRSLFVDELDGRIILRFQPDSDAFGIDSATADLASVHVQAL